MKNSLICEARGLNKAPVFLHRIEVDSTYGLLEIFGRVCYF